MCFDPDLEIKTYYNRIDHIEGDPRTLYYIKIGRDFAVALSDMLG